jgi:hypothetical protein
MDDTDELGDEKSESEALIPTTHSKPMRRLTRSLTAVRQITRVVWDFLGSNLMADGVVALILWVLAFAIPIPGAKWSLVLGGVALIVLGSISKFTQERERKRKDDERDKKIDDIRTLLDRPQVTTSTAEPDVILESSQGLSIKRHTKDSLEAVDLIVYNDSADATAMDIQIATLSSGDYHNGGFWSGDAATIAHPTLVNTVIRFELVPHLAGKGRAPVEPINPAFTVAERMMQYIAKMPENQRAADVSVGLWWFVDAALKNRVFAEPESADMSERAIVSRRLAESPIDIPIRVTYRDAQRVRRWERLETLHYDPTTLNAYISHDERLELTNTVTEHLPTGSLKIVCTPDHSEIVVRNDGVVADFLGTLRIAGPVLRRGYDYDDLLCRWSHTTSARTKIASGQERRIVLADNLHDTETDAAMGFSKWRIYAVTGGVLISVESSFASTPLSDPPAVAPDIVLEGTIFAEPALANGAQSFRVTLRAFEAVSE